jgi:hypothetical protein
MWTGTDLTTLLVVTLAIVAAVLVLRKRYDSNVPLLFYLAALVFLSVTERAMNPYLLYGGLACALLLRFEFLGRGVAKFVAFLTTSTLCLIAWMFLAQVFGEDLAPF